MLPAEGGSITKHGNSKPDYRVNPATGCWEWLKQRSRLGYGRGSFLSLGIKTNWAHRAYYIVANGPVADDQAIDHLCRNPSCVNPAHLEAVTWALNIQRGSGAKITMEIAREVRQRVQDGQPAIQIERELGVTIQNVWWIAEDRAWREDPSAPRRPVWPIRDCEECGEPIGPERGRRAKFCSDAHCKRFNNRRRYRKRRRGA